MSPNDLIIDELVDSEIDGMLENDSYYPQKNFPKSKLKWKGKNTAEKLLVGRTSCVKGRY